MPPPERTERARFLERSAAERRGTDTGQARSMGYYRDSQVRRSSEAAGTRPRPRGGRLIRDSKTTPCPGKISRRVMSKTRLDGLYARLRGGELDVENRRPQTVASLYRDEVRVW